MVYAMMSIGVLGFIVWSLVLASLYGDMKSYIFYFAICWNGLGLLIGTLNGKNSTIYTQPAGNLSLYSYLSNNSKQSASETKREKSFKFLPFRLYYNKLFGNDAQHLSFNWLTWFIGFVERDGAIQTYDKSTFCYYSKRRWNSLSHPENVGYWCRKAFSTRKKWKQKWFL